MAKIIIEINAESYYNYDALHEIVDTIENKWDTDLEEDKVDKEIKGKHFTARIKNEVS